MHDLIPQDWRNSWNCIAEARFDAFDVIGEVLLLLACRV